MIEILASLLLMPTGFFLVYWAVRLAIRHETKR